MISLREQGEYLRLALAMGLIDQAEVVAWADSAIASLEQPPIELIDIALAKKLSRIEFMKLLTTLPGSVDGAAAAHRVLGLLRHQFQHDELDLTYAVRALQVYYKLAQVSEAESLQANNFDDALFCARQGYCGTLNSVRKELQDFLDIYASEPDVPSG